MEKTTTTPTTTAFVVPRGVEKKNGCSNQRRHTQGWEKSIVTLAVMLCIPPTREYYLPQRHQTYYL